MLFNGTTAVATLWSLSPRWRIAHGEVLAKNDRAAGLLNRRNGDWHTQRGQPSQSSDEVTLRAW